MVVVEIFTAMKTWITVYLHCDTMQSCSDYQVWEEHTSSIIRLEISENWGVEFLRNVGNHVDSTES